MQETVDQHWSSGRGGEARGKPLPGLLLVFSGATPTLRAVALGEGPVVIGRGAVADSGLVLEDGCLSRRHAEVGYRGDTFTVRDLGSRNGTAVDGALVEGQLESQEARVLRAGDTLFLLCHDLRPYLDVEGVEVRGGLVIGPTLRRAWKQIEGVARSGDVLHVTGATGSGKELAARHFHQCGPNASGPFIAVNCATIPAALAERLLFGARKGAYSGADADTEGYLQSAGGGTLFLDEVSEVEAGVQAKLLRVIETREVVPLGGSRGRKVDVRFVSATHGELRDQVDQGRFREDLYYRLGRPVVALPSLVDRLEELPHLVHELLHGREAIPHASLVEAALLRAWPGNVRELSIEIREAARHAADDGSERVEARHLTTPPAPALRAPRTATNATTAPSARPEPAPDRAAVEQALEQSGGNISRAARSLGAHRTQFKRLMQRYGIEARPGSPGSGDPQDEPDGE